MTLTNTAGNLLASGTLAGAGTRAFDVDASGKFEAQIQLAFTFGAIGSPAGVQVDSFRRIGAGPAVDTVAVVSFIVSAVAGVVLQSLALPTGRWHILLTNLDTVNAVTAVTATDDTVDAIS